MSQHRSRTRRRPFRLAAAGAVTALAVLLAACSGAASPATEGAGGDPVSGGTLSIAFRADNTSLVSIDPFQVYWLEHRVVIRNVVESLTDQDPETGEIIPWLAESWEVSDDGLRYTFHLRDDVTFSNGEAFDATAVQTAFDANRDFAAENPTTFGATYIAGYDHAEIVDDHTITLVLDSPNAAFLQATSTTNLSILAPESYTRTADERSQGDIIGSGPFVLEEYSPEERIVLTKREGYAWASAASENQGEAYLDEVEITYVPEANVRNGSFQSGDLDIVWPREPFTDADLALLESVGGTIQSRSLPGPSWAYYANVQEGKILNDDLVRQALQLSIDRESYASTIYNADFDIVEGPYDQTTPYFSSQADKLAYDPDRAADLLDEAGWELGDDGYRYKDGERLTLVRLLQAESTGEVLVQDQLKQVGIDLELRVLVAGEYNAAQAAGDYDLTSSYMTRADPVILQTILDPRYTDSAIAVNAYKPEQLETVQDLFDAGLTELDTEARGEIYAELQAYLIDENISFPVYERLWQAATASDVHGFEWTSEGFALLNDIWLSDQE